MTGLPLTPPYMPPEQRDMFYQIYARQQERFSGYKVELVERFFPVTELKEPTIIGMFAWTSSASRSKWILKPHAVPNGGTWVTPGDIARDYLATKYKDRRVRCTTSQYAACVRDKRNPPVYCKPSSLEYAYYLDIRSAYWSILQAVGWDINYNPGRLFGVNSTMEDFPFPNNKMARNSLVSVGLSGGFTLWDGHKLVRVNKPNRFVNMLLWRVVCDVLNNVACDCIDAGAVYAYTDGFIVPAERLTDVQEVITHWGLDWSIKREGRCKVFAPAVYEFPGYRANKRAADRDISVNKTYREHRAFLWSRFSYFSLRGQANRRSIQDAYPNSNRNND